MLQPPIVSAVIFELSQHLVTVGVRSNRKIFWLTKTQALNFAYGFEEMDYDYQNVEAWRIGLTPSSVSANAAWKKKNTALTNPLLSDPNSSLLKALNFSLTKGNNRVGFALIDKERNVLARKYGRLDSVGMHLDDAICAFMGPRVLKDEDVEELRD